MLPPQEQRSPSVRRARAPSAALKMGGSLHRERGPFNATTAAETFRVIFDGRGRRVPLQTRDVAPGSARSTWGVP